MKTILLLSFASAAEIVDPKKSTYATYIYKQATCKLPVMIIRVVMGNIEKRIHAFVVHFHVASA